MTGSGFDRSEILSYGWASSKKNLLMFVLLILILALVEIALTRLIDFLFPHFLEGPLKWIAGVTCSYVFLWGCVKVHDGQPRNWSTVFSAPQALGNFILTQFLHSLIVCGGLILLIVPGIIWALQFGFAGLLAMEEGLDPINALKKSSALTKGHREDLFVMVLLLLGINLLGVLALGVGLFVTIPMTYLSWVRAYRSLRDLQGSAVAPPALT
jgi:uncharacterized membrane protein